MKHTHFVLIDGDSIQTAWGKIYDALALSKAPDSMKEALRTMFHLGAMIALAEVHHLPLEAEVLPVDAKVELMLMKVEAMQDELNRFLKEHGVDMDAINAFMKAKAGKDSHVN